MSTKLLGFGATGAVALALAAAPIAAQAAGLNQVSAGDDQYAIGVQDSLNDNEINAFSFNNNGNALTQDSHNDNSTNDSQIAALDSQAAGNDANVDSYNTIEILTDQSVNGSQSADRGGQAAGNDATAIDASKGSQVAVGDAYRDSFNDGSLNVAIGAVDLNLTSVVSEQALGATVSGNLLLTGSSVTTGSIFGGSGNFDSFAGINSQNINSGVMSVGLNASAINVHGQVTIGN